MEREKGGKNNNSITAEATTTAIAKAAAATKQHNFTVATINVGLALRAAAQRVDKLRL